MQELVLSYDKDPLLHIFGTLLCDCIWGSPERQNQQTTNQDIWSENWLTQSPTAACRQVEPGELWCHPVWSTGVVLKSKSLRTDALVSEGEDGRPSPEERAFALPLPLAPLAPSAYWVEPNHVSESFFTQPTAEQTFQINIFTDRGTQ